MNYIVLEGLGFYLVLIMVILMLLISIGCVIYAVLSDKRGFILEDLLLANNEKVKKLTKENFVLKLKHGEFDIDEK
ncbi:MAG: hypothetical protein IJN56_01315 [Clostridia bacterium]|nr:hypothetical protein [Clostridia bacterium]